MVAQHTVSAVERALGHSFQQTKGGHHGAGRQHFNLQVAAGHVIDLLGVVQRILVENVFGRPGALPAHGNRASLGFGDHGGRQGASGNRDALEQAATAGGSVISQVLLQEL